MIKKHSYYVTVKKVECKKWTPAPRNDATLTYLNYTAYLIGGMNYQVQPEISAFNLRNMEKNSLDMILPMWHRLRVNDMTSDQNNPPQPTFGHTSCAYKDFIYSFGGCFMYDKKR